MPTIPRRLHYCWYGNAPVSDLGRHCIETWRSTMPSYSIEVWDERKLKINSPYANIAYQRRKFAFVADYMRLLVLYREGGVYLDTDVEVVQPFDELLDRALFFGLQEPQSVGVSVIGAAKGHPFLQDVIDELDREGRSGNPSFQPLPELITAMINRRSLDKVAVSPKVTVFPEEYFYPYNPYSSVPVRRKPLQSNMSERTFCIHHWEGTWLGGMSLRTMVNLRLKNVIRKASVNVLRAKKVSRARGRTPR